MKLRSFLILCLCIIGCGSGNSGSDSTFVGAARVSLSVSPSTIDSHDRAQVSIKIENVIDTGILLKVRFSEKLKYAENTAKLTLESESDGQDIPPSFNGEDNSTTYLVFFLSRDLFGDISSGSSDEDISEPATLTFEVVGQSKLSDGTIEVDADVNDPLVDDGSEFNVDEPQFEAEDEAGISVR